MDYEPCHLTFPITVRGYCVTQHSDSLHLRILLNPVINDFMDWCVVLLWPFLLFLHISSYFKQACEWDIHCFDQGDTCISWYTYQCLCLNLSTTSLYSVTDFKFSTERFVLLILWFNYFLFHHRVPNSNLI